MDRWVRRLVQLQVGLVLYGVAVALQARAGLGLGPWDVFHQGLSVHTGIGLGWILNLVGAAVLLLWIPLRQRPGIGTVSNVLVIGTVAQLVLSVLPAPSHWAARVLLLASGILLCGIATGCYIGAGLGPGPRDGLMTGLARGGRSVRAVRTAIELAVVAAGYLLGGTVGIGTLVFAVSIGPVAQVFLPLFRLDEEEPVLAPAAGER
jgi:uncharacterized membrane protein YczE